MGNLQSYLKIIRKWWWIVALLCASTVGTMLVLAFFTDTEYLATVTVQVSAPPPQEVPLYSQFGRQALRDEIEQNRTNFNEILLEGDVSRKTINSLPDAPMGARELLEKVTIEIPESSQLMRIQVRAGDPETAALLANRLVEVGLEEYGEFKARSTANTRQFIERQLQSAQVELDAAEAELAQFQINNKIGSVDEAINAQYDLIRSLRIQRDVAQAEGFPAKAQGLDKIILNHEAELQNMLGLSADYTGLRDRVERARAMVDFLLDKNVEAQVKENQILEVGFIQVITPARPPNRPVAAIDGRLIALGAIASVLAGVLLAFLLEYLEMSGAFRNLRQPTDRAEPVVALSDSTS